MNKNENKQNYIYKYLKLHNIDYVVKYRYNEQLHESLVPNKYLHWITKIIDYQEKNKYNPYFDALIVFILFSAKMFNLYLYNKTILYDKVWDIMIKKIKQNHHNIILGLNKFIKDSPKNNIDIICYHGLSYNLFKLYYKNDYFIPNKFISGTLDKYHAANYAYQRGQQEIDYKHEYDIEKLYMVISITIPKNSNVMYHTYENQIIFPFDTKFKILNIQNNCIVYKDIMDSDNINNYKKINGLIAYAIAYT